MQPCEPHRFFYPDLSVRVEVSYFSGADGPSEYHVLVEPDPEGTLVDQLELLAQAYERVLAELGVSAGSAVWRRCFLSDPANQYATLEAHSLFSEDAECAVSLIGQAPQSGSKLALLAYHIVDTDALQTERSHKRYELQRGALRHQWCTKFSAPQLDGAHTQSVSIFDQYMEALASVNANLLEHAVRTWIYVRDVDHNYADMVQARNEVFAREGLTRESHYIASTGIESRFGKVNALVFMDAYSIAGLLPEQVDYLQAEEHLGRTDDYGVCFERATAVSYRDRKHVFISGTASIDPNGEVLFEGDVIRQLQRAIENVEALLASADASIEDMAHWIVYLRDPADALRVRAAIEERIVGVPVMIVAGAVCRPNWLVEIEGLAIAPHADDSLPRF